MMWEKKRKSWTEAGKYENRQKLYNTGMNDWVHSAKCVGGGDYDHYDCNKLLFLSC